MQLPKVCMILSCILIAVNLLLVGLYFTTKHELTTLSDTLVTNAAAYFTSRGCSVSPSVLEKEIPSTVIVSFEMAKARERIESAVPRFADGKALPTAVDTPDGALLHGTLAGKKYTLRLYDADTAFSFTADARGTEEPLPDMSDAVFDGEKNAYTDLVTAFFTRLGGKKCASFELSAPVEGEACEYICARQMMYGVPVRDETVVLAVKDNEVTAAKGKWITSDAGETYTETLLDGVNAVYRLDLGTLSRVDSEKIAYTVRLTDNGIMYLVPVWEIRGVDTKNAPVLRVVEAIDGDYVN